MAFFALVVISVTAVILFGESIRYSGFLLYLVLLPLFFFTERDVKLDKRDFIYMILFVLVMALLSAGQYFFSLSNLIYLKHALIFVKSAAALYIFSIFARKKHDNEPAEFYIKGETIGVALLFVFSLVLRIYRINEIPTGVWFDEAQNGNELINMVGSNSLPVFIPRITQMPALFFYFADFLTKIFGMNIFSLRLVSILLGTFNVMAFYFLARHIFKDYRIALAASIMLAASEWHMDFSRVAFLGMQTVFLETVFFYFYLKMTEDEKIINPVMAGITMGINLYTFSAAYFVPFIVALYSIVLLFKNFKSFMKIYLINILLTVIIAFVVALPLLNYAKNNLNDFTQRARDVSISNDLKKSNNLLPLISNIEKHFLMFNYEGDYNGRHNLSKAPMLDNISGVLLVAGFLAAVFNPEYYLYLLWFLVMLLPGIMTNSIEAPQAYRTIAIIPAVYLLIAIAFSQIKNMLLKINKNTLYLSFLFFAVAFSAATLNIYRYFFVYAHSNSTYISFSPEATEISQCINDNYEKYYVMVSPANNMYPFYSEEQVIVSAFLTYGKGTFTTLGPHIKDVNKNELIGKKGILFIIRPTDTELEQEINKEYPDAVKEEHKNPYTGDVNFICFYVNTPGGGNAK